MSTMKPNAVSAICLAAIILLATAPVITYATASPTGVAHPSFRMFLTAPILLNPQTLPAGVMPNVSLRLLLYGHTNSLNGTLTIQGNRSPISPSAAPAPGISIPIQACQAVAKGSIVVLNQTDPTHQGFDIFAAVNATFPPSPCFAGLQGYQVEIQWQLLTGKVTLTASPQISSAVQQPTLQWIGQSAATSGITQLPPQPSQPD